MRLMHCVGEVIAQLLNYLLNLVLILVIGGISDSTLQAAVELVPTQSSSYLIPTQERRASSYHRACHSKPAVCLDPYW